MGERHYLDPRAMEGAMREAAALIPKLVLHVAEPQSCRLEILEALDRLQACSGIVEFTPAQVVAEMQRAGTTYKVATIKTHIIARMCEGSARAAYEDLERVGHGRYRRRQARLAAK